MSYIKQMHEQNGTQAKEGTELIQRIEIENTPFTMVGNDEVGFIITMGVMRLTDKKTYKECMNIIGEKSYDLIITVINAMIIHHDQVKHTEQYQEAIRVAYNIKKEKTEYRDMSDRQL